MAKFGFLELGKDGIMWTTESGDEFTSACLASWAADEPPVEDPDPTAAGQVLARLDLALRTRGKEQVEAEMVARARAAGVAPEGISDSVIVVACLLRYQRIASATGLLR